jgi:hypothetical protein
MQRGLLARESVAALRSVKARQKNYGRAVSGRLNACLGARSRHTLKAGQ